MIAIAVAVIRGVVAARIAESVGGVGAPAAAGALAGGIAIVQVRDTGHVPDHAGDTGRDRAAQARVAGGESLTS